MTDPLAQTFLEVQRAAWGIEPRDAEELDRTISRIAADGRRAWLGVEIDPVTLARHLAERAPDRTEPIDALAEMATTDLYLALGCLERIAAALDHFERSVMTGVAPAVARVDASAAFAREIEEEVRVKMLAPADGSTPRLATYLGRGPLRSWVQVVAIRTAYGAKRAGAKDAPEDLAKLGAMVLDGAPDPELARIRAEVAEPFARAFRSALLSLPPRDRNVLRMYVIEGLAAETIGRMYQAHRATVARWIARAEKEVLAATRRALERDLGLARADVDSLLRAAKSQLDVSLGSFLD